MQIKLIVYDASYQFSAVKYVRYRDELMDYDFFSGCFFCKRGWHLQTTEHHDPLPVDYRLCFIERMKEEC